ncbi:MAG: DUF2934 domain-containing protein [Methylophilaceae bacterium]
MKSGKARSNEASSQTPTTTLESAPQPGNEDRYSRIAVAAYYKAEARGFSPGDTLEDWLAAEVEEQ